MYITRHFDMSAKPLQLVHLKFKGVVDYVGLGVKENHHTLIHLLTEKHIMCDIELQFCIGLSHRYHKHMAHFSNTYICHPEHLLFCRSTGTTRTCHRHLSPSSLELPSPRSSFSTVKLFRHPNVSLTTPGPCSTTGGLWASLFLQKDNSCKVQLTIILDK